MASSCSSPFPLAVAFASNSSTSRVSLNIQRARSLQLFKISAASSTASSSSSGSDSGSSSSDVVRTIICQDCTGNGAKVCSQCKGEGRNSEDHFGGRYKAGEICWLCRGKKEILCGNCNGAGFVASTTMATVAPTSPPSRTRQTKRRAVVAQLIAASVFLLNSATFTDLASCEQVRLEDVEDPRLKDAIQASVSGDFQQAEAILSNLLAEDATSASIWSNRGNVRVSMGKYEQALDDFNQAVKLAPEAPVPLLNRAIANEALGRLEEAVADCQAAIKIDPKEYAAWYNLGNVDVRLKDYKSALAAYETAAALAPGIAGYRLKQALILFQLQKTQQATQLLEGLVRKYPNYVEARAALAAVLWSQGRRVDAEDQLGRAERYDPTYTNVRWITANLNWPPMALEAMNRLVTIDTK